jgi:hypothetical protein
LKEGAIRFFDQCEVGFCTYAAGQNDYCSRVPPVSSRILKFSLRDDQ